MCVKTFLVAFAILFTSHSVVEAQLFRRSSRAPQANCYHSSTCQQLPQYAPATVYRAIPQAAYPTIPVEGFQPQIGSVDSASVVNSLPFEPLYGSGLYQELNQPAQVVSLPQYGISSNWPYSSVVGSSPVASDLLPTNDVEAIANAGVPTAAVGQSTIEMGTLEAPAVVVAPSVQTISIEPAASAGNQPLSIVAPGISDRQATPKSIIETHTLAPVTPDEPAPTTDPGQLEMGKDGGSVFNTDSGN
jgi:hypothetical protein